MKKGDRVKVIAIHSLDKGANLNVGDIGIINAEYEANGGDSETDVFEVLFENLQVSGSNANELNNDGTYNMWRSQLEVIEAAS